jgi:hypothetical protein
MRSPLLEKAILLALAYRLCPDESEGILQPQKPLNIRSPPLTGFGLQKDYYNWLKK